jgi:DNA polymerase
MLQHPTAHADILMVGDIPGEHEEKQSTPFVGPAGQELTRLLDDAGIVRGKCALTNVFLQRAPGNDINQWGVSRAAAGPWPIPTGISARYIRADYVMAARKELLACLTAVNPNIIVALGNVAMTMLTGQTGIGRTRGALHHCTLFEPGLAAQQRKVIGTYHPAAVLRQYDLRPVAVADLEKVLFESKFPEMRLRRRALHLEPTVADLPVWRERLLSAEMLAVDCETKNGQMTCLGFATSPTEAFVIPFWDRRQPDWHYWRSLEEERLAWDLCREVLASPIPKILQNGLYDLQYFLRYHMPMRSFHHDTMIRHHSLYPGFPKGLDFLGSLYVTERAWKKYRPRGGEEKSDA